MTSSRLALRAWPWVMSIAVCAPLLAPGYVLSYDMVWVPHLSVTRPDLWGFGSALPRAVPSDAVIAVLDTVVPGQLLQKVMLVSVLGLAGTGAGRLLAGRSAPARLAAASWYVWNPFLAERLVLGQWPLLIGYAALPWVAGTCLAPRADRRWWIGLVAALAATAMSPASGLMGALVAGCCAGGRRAVLAVTAAVNLPWVVAGVLHAASGRTDASAVALFDLQPEAHLGRLGAALSLGGVWNVDVVPASRSLLVSTVCTVVLWAVMLAGLRVGWRSHRRLVRALGVPAVVGLLVALAGWVATDELGWFVANVPGGGLLRDGSRYLALLAPLEAVLLGLGVVALAESTSRRAVRQFVATLGVLLPLVALPDLGWGAAGALRPVSYPAAWTAARDAVDDSLLEGDVLVLPFTSYRAPAWNRGHPVLDPAGRFFTRPTVTNDDLVVSGSTIEGEDRRARRIGAVLAGDAVADGLRREGIGFVVVEGDAGDLGPAAAQIGTLHPVFASRLVDVYAVP